MPKPEYFLIPVRVIDPNTGKETTVIEQEMYARELLWRGKPSFSALARELRKQTPPYKAGYRALARYVQLQSPDSIEPKRYPLEANAMIIATYFGKTLEQVWQKVKYTIEPVNVSPNRKVRHRG